MVDDTMRKALSDVKSRLQEERDALDDIVLEVKNGRNALQRLTSTVAKSVASLQEERSETARTLRDTLQSVADKTRVERDLRSGLSGKDGEIRRLAAELRKAKDAISVRDESRQKDITDLQQKLEETTRSEYEARRRLSLSETSTSSRKEVVTLSSMLEVNKVEVEKLREELEKQSRSHSLRIAELQESFQNKIKELRRVHKEQMSATHVGAADEMRAQIEAEFKDAAAMREAECAKLREEVHALNARIEALDLASSCAKRGLVDAKRKEADAVKIGLATKQDLARHKAEAEALRKQLAESAAALEKAQREGEAAANAAKAAMAAPKQDLSMLDIMEQQLVKLSQLVNTKEEEIESLKLTVEKECQERGFLVAELNMLRKKAAR